MAVANTKSTLITNLDANPSVRSSRSLAGDDLKVQLGYVAVASGDDNDSLYRVCRLPSNAVVYSILVTNTAMTGATDYNVGLYKIQTLTGADGAVVNENLFADAIDLSSANTNLEVRHENSLLTTSEKRIWELLGLSSDSGLMYDLTLKGVAVGSAAGTIKVVVHYSV